MSGNPIRIRSWMVMTLLPILKAGSDSGRVQWRILTASDRSDVGIEGVSIKRPDVASKLGIRIGEMDYEPPRLMPPTNFTARFRTTDQGEDHDE